MKGESELYVGHLPPPPPPPILFGVCINVEAKSYLGLGKEVRNSFHFEVDRHMVSCLSACSH